MMNVTTTAAISDTYMMARAPNLSDNHPPAARNTLPAYARCHLACVE